MDSEIKLIPEGDFEGFLAIVSGAFPEIGLEKPETRDRMLTRFQDMLDDPSRELYGCYRNDVLQGGMIVYDFSMNVHGIMIPAGGVGLVAVHLIHRKEHVAKELMSFFISHYQVQQTPFLLLYPFRPDFYRKMGFGYGTKINEYTIRPRGIHPGSSKEHVRFFTKDDFEKVWACANRVTAKTHGMIAVSDREITFLLEHKGHHVIGYETDGVCRGYLTFEITPGQRLNDKVTVRNIVYENSAALAELLSFLHSQQDQFKWMTITTHDETFQHLLDDPRDNTSYIIPHVYHQSNVQGVGLMYRVIDVNQLFRLLEKHDFGGVTCRLAINLRDSFVSENSGRFVINFANGKPSIGGTAWDVEIALDVSEFSSLVMGVIGFKKLHQYGLVTISDPSYLESIDRIFWSENRPVCLTRF